MKDKYYPLKDTDIKIIDGDRGDNYPNKRELFDKEYCLFLDTSNVTKEGFSFESTKFISQEKDSILGKGKLQRYDIVMTTRGSVGNVGYYNDSIMYDNIRINSGMVIIRCCSAYLSEFIYYYLQSDYFKKQVDNFRSGSVQSQLPISILKEVKIPNICKEIQKNIIDVLSPIINKLKLNNKINTELEKIAKTIYGYWFLQFDFPNEEGKPYKSSGGKMVWNEKLKRVIPEGWKDGIISDLGEVVAGGTPSTVKKEYFTEDGIAWITPKDLAETSCKYITHGAMDISELGLKNSSAKLMKAGSVLFTTRAPIGYIAISLNPVCTNQGFKSIVPLDKFGLEYVYYTLDMLNKRLQSIGVGTTFKEVSKEVFSNEKVILPDEVTLIKYKKIMKSISNMTIKNQKESQELISLRDFLLPLLMNEQVGFKEQQKLQEVAVTL